MAHNKAGIAPLFLVLIAGLLITATVAIITISQRPAEKIMPSEGPHVVIDNQSSALQETQPEIPSSTPGVTQENTSSITSHTLKTEAATTTVKKISKISLPKNIPSLTPPIIQPTSTPTSTTPIIQTPPPTLPSRHITPKSIVGLLCYYTTSNPAVASAFGNENGKIEAKGSGVIIHPDGYILTAKHIVDPAFVKWFYYGTSTEQVIEDTLTFDYCEVGLPNTENLPTPQEIQSLNPSIELQHPFPYIATLDFNPVSNSLSNLEYESLDFAILKITRTRDDCQTFNMCKLPNSFSYNPVTIDTLPANYPLINFGYPAEVINSQGGGFSTFLLKGAVGYLDSYVHGDQHLKNIPLYFKWSADDVLPGRSGSPVFWKGYVVGLVSSIQSSNVTIIRSIAMPAIYKILQEKGLTPIISKN